MVDTWVIFITLFLLSDMGQSLSPTLQAQPPVRPHLTGCISREMTTFRCSWDIGTFQNLTDSKDIRFFYMLLKNDERKWNECPSYSSIGGNECYFDSSNTKIWFFYVIQLRSRAQDIIYDEEHFHVEDIVYPDPPLGLNWTLLSVGPTRMFCDVVVSWEVPPSAAETVKMGWLTLSYETGYREIGSTEWSSLDVGKDIRHNMYGLRTNTEYEIRVRCKKWGYSAKFGNFSDSIFIYISTKESRIPVAAVSIFAAVSVGIILILIIVSRQQKLMVIFLPPVPGPKIKGIDPEILQKGKLAELISILGMHHDLRPELYSNDPWVEFMEVDIDEPHERMDGMETQLLIGHSPSSDGPHLSSGFRDDDSGRASCCDPDLPDPYLNELHSPPASNVGLEPSSLAHSETTSQPVVPSLGECPSASRNLYSQVIYVTPYGEVVLSPEGQSRAKKAISKDEEKGKGKEFQLQVVDPDGGGYTSELDASKISAKHSTGGYYEPTLPCTEGYHNPYLEAEIPSMPSGFPIPALPPSPEYTMVDGVDRQNSLLLKPNSPVAHHPVLVKALQTPEGYLTPDLLDNIAP